MKITKYPQSSMMLEVKGTKVLVDPGTIAYKDEYFDKWSEADFIIITHKHPDHCHTEVLEKLGKKIYSSQEVQDANKSLSISIVKENDVLEFDGFKIEVVHAIHGYQPLLKGDKEIHENIGYIVDDGDKRLYITSDTICFKNDYKADVIWAPVTGYGLTMSAFEASLFAKEAGASLLLPIHMDNPTFPPDFNFIEKMFAKYPVNYKIPVNEETFEI